MTSTPSIQAWPPVGLSRPASRCISVDLPEPEGPTIAVSSPAGKSRRDAAQGVDRGLALAEAAAQVPAGDDPGVPAGAGLTICPASSATRPRLMALT